MAGRWALVGVAAVLLLGLAQGCKKDKTEKVTAEKVTELFPADSMRAHYACPARTP